jgi:flagellar hook-associated protein 3 FlgL
VTIAAVSTSAQSQILLGQVQTAENNLAQTEQQVASGYVSSTYGGIGDQTSMLVAAQTQVNAATAYANAAQNAANQVNVQDTQLTQLAAIASQWQQDITNAVATNNGSSLMTQAQDLYDQATQILNAQDSSGNYIYGGGNNNTPPVAPANLAALQALPSASAAFTNGNQPQTVLVGAGQTVQIGVLASSVGTGFLQSLQDVANFNAGANGNFGATLNSTQANFLSGEIANARNAAQSINDTTGTNGETYQQLQAVVTNQQSLTTVYTGFVSDIQDVNMATASANLSLNQTALQAGLEMTAQLNGISLLNYLSTPTTG